MNDTRKKALQDIIDKLEDIRGLLEVMQDESGLLDEAANDLTGVISCLEDAME